MAYPRHMRRIERLINLIAALLETRQPLTAEQIRERIAGYDQTTSEAFRRSFERDKEALRALGIPLELRRTGPFDADPEGYVIPKDKYYVPDLDLEPDELAALRIAAGAVLGAGSQAASGLMKLSLNEPGEGWKAPRVVWGADIAAEQPLLGPAYAAVSERQAVSFEYATSEGEVAVRTIEPYGLVHRRGNWYLVGRDRDRDAIRGFRLSRVGGEIRRVEGSYDVPEHFRPEEHVGLEAWEVGSAPAERATVRFSRAFRWWAEQNLGAEKHSPGPEGTLDVDLSVTNADALISWVIGFGGEVEIVAPPAIRERLTEHLAPFREGADA